MSWPVAINLSGPTGYTGYTGDPGRAGSQYSGTSSTTFAPSEYPFGSTLIITTNELNLS